MEVYKYLSTRITSLKPPLIVPENPIKLLRMLNRRQVAFFLVAFFAWTWDAFDFFSVTFNVIKIGETFNRSTVDITWSITVTLMFRSIGAIIFGITGDRFGRKWPFVINIILYGVIEIASGFATTYTQFIGFRAIFGIAMGGIYGNCAATALEDAPIVARGLLSGLLQQGYACGYLLAGAFNLAITNNQKYGWRALFWFGGSVPLLIAVWRIFLPETETFQRVKQIREAEDRADNGNVQTTAMHAFLHRIRPAISRYWLIIIYMVLMMTGFNFLSHGSQDLYPTFLTSSLEFSQNLVTLTTNIANLGAILGGMFVGYFSSFFGRRLSILVVLIVGACVIPAYVLPHDKSIIVGAFFQQMCVQGVWGVVPIHLIELSPIEFRSFVVGTAYQLGNLISAASSTIEAKAGEHFPRKNSNNFSGHHHAQYDYGKVMAVFLSCVYVYLFVVILLGPENRNIGEATESTQKKELDSTSDNSEDKDLSSSTSDGSKQSTEVENVA